MLLYIDIEDITRRERTTLTRSSPQNPNADSTPPAEWTGFKIVGDNIHKTVRPRHMRSDRQAQSLHYFHSYAVKDRVNISSVSDSPPIPPECPHTELLETLLPSAKDVTTIHSLFEVHVARILVEHFPFMKSAFADVVDWHIQHEYYEEMGETSDVVSEHSSKISPICFGEVLFYFIYSIDIHRNINMYHHSHVHAGPFRSLVKK